MEGVDGRSGKGVGAKQKDVMAPVAVSLALIQYRRGTRVPLYRISRPMLQRCYEYNCIEIFTHPPPSGERAGVARPLYCSATDSLHKQVRGGNDQMKPAHNTVVGSPGGPG